MVRVRFAPSPTGPLHMGGVRTALYNYLFAKKNKGTFIVRIEDTDQSRFVSNAESYIQASLKWCNIEADESPWKEGGYGPYRQSERKHLYKDFAMQLVNNDFAYYAFDTAEELEEMREKLKKAKVSSPQYNNITRNSMKNSLTLSKDEVEKKLAAGEPYVIRLKVPRNEDIRFHDEIRGWIVVQSNHIDDKVIFKSDGMPTYHLANIVDDYLMKITHVIRGEEWLPSAPLHVLLYRYLGWEENMPKFAHLPLILKPDGNGKLSKRDGDRLGFPVFPLNWADESSGSIFPGYKEKGYYPEAFINMLALLGWNPGTEQEIFSLGELCEAFSLERVGKAGAKFDAEKTKWFNQQYLRQKDNELLAKDFEIILKTHNIEYQFEKLESIVDLMKERSSFVEEMLEGIYFFRAPSSFDEKTIKKKWKADSAQQMNDLYSVLNSLDDFTADKIESHFKEYLENNNFSIGQVMPNLRLLITGLGFGPSIFAICSILGKAEVLKRIKNGLNHLPN